jgi:hypothetical protein
MQREDDMPCLSNAEIQAVADNEAAEPVRAHAAACARCAGRVADRRRQMAEFVALTGPADDVPAQLDAGVRRALSGGQVRGSTSLRTRAPSWHARAWASAIAGAAVVALVVFIVLPRLGAPTKLSAAEILGRSLQTLTAVRGVEQLEYELVATGVLNGTHRIEQTVDHDRPNRFRLANYGPDGTLESALSQDPVTGRRSQLIRVDGRNFVINVNGGRSPLPSVPGMIQAQLEALIVMMQATTHQNLTSVDGPTGMRYVIQIPATAANSGGLLDIAYARVVVNAADFVIEELDASGAALRQPFAGSFRLIRRSTRPASEVPAGLFSITPGAGDVVLEADGSGDPLSDVLITALRELARAKGY